MHEQDIEKVNVLHRNKKELLFLKKDMASDVTINVQCMSVHIQMRSGVLLEAINKEIDYTTRRLKSLGIKEFL